MVWAVWKKCTLQFIWNLLSPLLSFFPLFPPLLWEIVKSAYLSTLNELMVWSHLGHSEALMIFRQRTEHSHPRSKKTSCTQNGPCTSRMPEIQGAHKVPLDTWSSPYLYLSLQRWRALLGEGDCQPKKGWSYLCVHSLRSLEHHWRLTPFCHSLQEDRAVHHYQTSPFALVLNA